MSNKFNEFGGSGDSSSVTNGSLDIYGFSLKAENLEANQPLKTNSDKQLVSTQLSISDVVNLQAELDSSLQNPNQNNLISDGVEVTAGNVLKTDTLTSTTIPVIGTKTVTVDADLSLTTGKNLVSDIVVCDTLSSNSGTGEITLTSVDLNASGQSITNVGNLYTSKLLSNVTEIQVENNLRMRSNDIVDVDSVEVNTNITTPSIQTNTITTNTTGKVLFNSDVDLFSNDILSSGNIKTTSFSSTDVKTNDIDVDANLDFQGTRELKQVNTADIWKLKSTAGGIINCSGGNNIVNLSGLSSETVNCNTLNDLGSNGVNLTGALIMTGTKYIQDVADLGVPLGGYYVIPDSTTYVIMGQHTLQYGFQFGANCSLRGIDFSAQITFDETSRDCDIKAVDNNFYLSQLTIIGGGGRFTGNTASVRGLLNATNYDVSAPAPFYERNKRFKVTDVNILRPFKIGTVEGFGTLNITNNFFNGGGGLAGQASNYYTNEGLSISDGLSLEFNNNKVVLMAGSQQASTLKMLNMKARVSSLLGFNAVTITGNIFHPRNAETGIDFDADSRTQLGNISGNVFIRTGGTSPLINYTDQPTYDNYNVDSVRNYNINANTGIVDSEPTLKSGFGTSEIITTASYEELEFTDNAQVLPITESSRFCIQLDLTGVSTAFVANERITDTASSNTALIMSVDAESGGNQSVYILDMSGTFNATPTTFTSATGSASGGTLRMRYKYLETDPRKLTLNMSITFTTDENKDEETTFAPGDGTTPDTDCEVPINTRNDAVGGHLTLICVRRWTTGDIINFYAKTADATTEMNIIKALVAIN